MFTLNKLSSRLGLGHLRSLNGRTNRKHASRLSTKTARAAQACGKYGTCHLFQGVLSHVLDAHGQA